MRNSSKTYFLIISTFAFSQLFAWEHFSVDRVSARSSESRQESGVERKDTRIAIVDYNDDRLFEPQAVTCGDDRWDPQFHPHGTNEDVFATAVSGNDLYLGGAFIAAGDKIANGIAKFNTLTQAWSALGTGVGGTSPIVNAVVVNGTDIYVGGTFTTASGVSAARVAKYDTITATWSALGSGVAGTSASVNALAVLGTDVYAGGVFTTAGGGAVANIARWDITTSTWSPVGTGVAGTIRAFVVSGGELYVSGAFGSAGGITANNVAKWSGSAWSALISGPTNGVGSQSFAMAASGSDVYITSLNTVVRWNGSTLTSLGGPTLNTLKGVHVVGSQVYAGGIGGTFGRWNGSWTTGIGGGIVTGTEGVYSIKDVGGQLYVAGRIVSAGGIGVFRIAKLNLATDTWSPVSGGNGIGGFFGAGALAAMGTDVYVVSDFRAVGTLGSTQLGKWDSIAQTWSPVGTGFGGTAPSINTMVVNGTDLYVGGSFTSAGGVGASNIAKWDSITNTWSALGTGLNSSVNSIAVSGGVVYVAGGFSTAGGSPANKIARFDTSTNTWSAMGSGIPVGFSFAYSIAVSGNNVFMGGDFTSIGGVSANRVARFDISAGTWSAMGTGISGGSQFVQSVAVSGTDVYVGGQFTTAGSIPANNIARWNGTTWSALGSGAAPTATGIVGDLEVNGGDLYAAGSFTTMGGVTVNNIAKWNGSGWSGLGNGVQAGSFVSGVDTMGTDVYVAGSFATAGNKPSMLFGRYSDVSVTWTGAVDSDWDNPGNWVGAAVPSAGAYALVPDFGVVNDPVISSDVQVCSLSLKPGRNLTVSSGGNLTVNSDLSLMGNNITVSDPAVVTIGADAFVNRTSGHIIGRVRRMVTGLGSFIYHVGTSNGYTPVTINFDSGSGDFSVRANAGGMSGLEPDRSLQQTWALDTNGITQADITVQYLQSDVPVTAAEAFFVFHRKTAGIISTPGIFGFSAATNLASLQNVTQFSDDWTLGEPSAVGCLAGQATWDGGGATNNWSEGNNWICDTTPSPTDTILFDNRSAKNVTIDQDIVAGGLQINPGFTGTVTQGSANVTINGVYFQRTGTWIAGSGASVFNGNFLKQTSSFTGGSGPLDFNGDVANSSGSFVMSSGTTTFAGTAFGVSAAGFDHNNGMFIFDGPVDARMTLQPSTFLNNLTLNAPGRSIQVIGSSIMIGGSLDLVDGRHEGSTLDARGNVTVGPGFDGGSGNIQFGGTAAQTYTDNGGIAPIGFWILNKTGGTVTLATDLDLTGGTNTLILTSGTITTGANVVNAGIRPITRSSGRIIGNLRRTFDAVGSKTFDVGTASGYSPVAVNVTSLATNPSSLTISSDQTTYTGMNPAQSAARFWTISETGDLTANLTFTYLQTDVVGSEPDYKLYRWEGAVPELMAATLNTTSNTYIANGISNFSDWAIGNLAPSAANVSISGRVVSAYGNGIANTELTVTDNDGEIKRALTSGFGYYRIEGLEAGRTYVLRVRSKRYTFANPVRVIVVNDDLTGEDFVAESK